MSIRQKLLLSLVAIAAIIGVLGGLASYHDIEQAEHIAQREAAAIARTVSLFAANRFGASGSLHERSAASALQRDVMEFKASHGRDIVIVDMQEKIIADAIPSEIGMVFSHDKDNEVGQSLNDGRIRAFSEVSEAYPRGIRQLVVPLELDSGKRAGGVIVEYSPLYEEILDGAKGNAKRYAMAYLAALAVSLLGGSLLYRNISRPLAAMHKAALRIANGDFDVAVESGSRDELGALAKSFNRMTEGLRQSRDRLLVANRELEAESALRSKSEEALRESELKFRTLFEDATDGLFILDLEGNFIDVNRTAYERLGYRKVEMLSFHISRLNAPEFNAILSERLQQLKREERAVFESAHLRKDGTAMPVEINAKVLDFGGRKVLFSVVRDITGRKQAEEDLKKTNARLQALIQTIPDMVLFKDVSGRHVIVNRAVKEITGHGSDEMVGKTVEELLPPGPAAACRKSDEEAMRNRVPLHVEEPLIDKDGNERYFDMLKAAMVDERDTTVGLVAIGRDITRHKQVDEELRRHREELVHLVEERTRELARANEKLRREIAGRERMEEELIKAQKLESLGVLAGGIAHDFNNLLTSVLGNISMALLDLDKNHLAYKELERAERASLRAQDLTQQLLTFSRGGAPVKKTASIGDLIRDSAGFALRGAKVKCDLAVPDDLRLVDIDEGQMSQVIHNLVINAEHAMPEGGTITIRCENVTLPSREEHSLSAGDYVRIMVRDSGMGIPKEHLRKIFDPYFTTKQRGSGLGLATTYSIIKKHSGSISVQSKLGAGTTFTIHLPASSDVAVAKKTEEERMLAAGGTILVMDDEEDVRDTVGSLLKRLGYTVAFAEDGSRAIELYRKAKQSNKPFDAVIMDLTVPGGMGGQEAVKRLLEIDPAARAIVSSGYSNDPIMANYRQYGFAGVVAKPFRIKELGLVVHRALSGSAADGDGTGAAGS